ncbi:hypothetical protein PG997_014729 [Apiospora hydei]|uniref:Uncharacterized protein n=1 Tax=Apiospora hydei TaxID=1337664 RepID=A0ABR1UVD6_9PEZI
MANTVESDFLGALNQSTRATVATEFWGKCGNAQPKGFHSDLTPFWEYYSRACRQALHDAGRHNALRSHADIIEVVRMLKLGATRNEIRTALRSKLSRTHENESELLDSSINLSASLLLMCDFGITPLSFSGRTELSWTQGTLQTFLRDYFNGPLVLSHEGMKLEKTFLAKNLSRIGGIDIIWTENLVDHLRLSNDDTKVHIFHHASFLEYQNHRQLGKPLAQWLSRRDATDARAAMPQHGPRDSPVAVEAPSIDRRLGHCGRLKTELRQIERFHFWRDRLIMLKQAYDEAQPKTLTQWWHDRRNGVQWYTFWVAVLVLVLTIVFGLIQSVEGALQVYASFKSLER